jgi:hypothetical protein
MRCSFNKRVSTVSSDILRFQADEVRTTMAFLYWALVRVPRRPNKN